MARNKYDIDETLDEKYSSSNLKRALVYVKPYTFKMILAFVLSSCASVLSLIGPSLLQKAMDVAIPNKDMAMLTKLACITLGTVIISTLFGAVRGIIMSKVGQSLVYDIRRDVFNHLQELPFSYYDSRPHGKILVRVVQYVNAVSDMLSNGIINIIIELLNVIFIAVFMFQMDARLALIILAGLPVLLTIMFIIKPLQRKVRLIHNNKSSNLTAYTCENIDGVRVSQLFDRQKVNIGIYDKLSALTKKAWLNSIYVMGTVWFSTENISQWVVSFVYVAGIMWFTPSVEVGVLIAMATYASRFWQPITALANLYNNFLNTVSYLERIFQTIDEPVDICDAENAYKLEDMQGNVEFKNVSFEYEKGIRVLNDVSFTVKKGESIALVGPTGAGKSTIVNLISRFYNVTEGNVYIDGNDINEVTINSLRSQMGIMLQDSFIFSGTIADNIRYGRLDATQAEIEAACKAVHADDFIKEMECGYETVVNERGGRLSQGQKQLIAFARTMLSDPAILILDEATSSIDAKTERLLQQGIETLLKGRTSFIIAHRLSTIKSCDKIMFIDGGRIVECGNHDELMALRGRYYDLCTAQTNEE
ncbi:MAG: ABC transporter ATP-binding protein [Clostridia bacterium]|nr:ABC transporter ATP-binding protein [Clostridia bacterium]